MMDEIETYTLIQSYVKNRWFVSTALRRSSAVGWHDTVYFETLAWEWDCGTKALGKIVFQGESCLTEECGLLEHYRVVIELLDRKSDTVKEA